MALLIQYTPIFASVLMLVALGGCFSEHSGIINIGLEGIMVMGAMGGALVKLRKNGKLYSGNGISTDIIGASIKAYINAVNKIVYEEA